MAPTQNWRQGPRPCRRASWLGIATEDNLHTSEKESAMKGYMAVVALFALWCLIPVTIAQATASPLLILAPTIAYGYWRCRQETCHSIRYAGCTEPNGKR